MVMYTVPEVDENTTLNNFGDNINLKVDRNRQKNATESDLKYILFWNEAYGTKEYDIGFGRQPFYDNLCPETRCFTTEDRNLKPVEEFDAVFFHQRSLDFSDIPDKKKRKVCEVFLSCIKTAFFAGQPKVYPFHHGVCSVPLYGHTYHGRIFQLDNDLQKGF